MSDVNLLHSIAVFISEFSNEQKIQTSVFMSRREWKNDGYNSIIAGLKSKAVLTLLFFFFSL